MPDERPLSDLPPPPPVPPPPPPVRPQRSALGWLVLIVLAIVIAVALINGCAKARAAASLTPVQAPVPMRTAHYMADHWAAEPYWKPHRVESCWRGTTTVQCYVFYWHFAEPVTFSDTGRAYGTWSET
jgi:hypothetical protein